jgi:uncharacterized protein (TIGR03086 family)
VTADHVGRLIELGRDGEAAHLAVRETGGPKQREKRVMVGPLEQLEVLIPGFVRLASEDREGFLDRPTPCEGWVVRDLLDHVNGGARMFAAAFEERAVRERELGDQPVETVAEALADFDSAVRSAGALGRTVNSPFGPMPGEMFARLAALDLLVHTWDLSRATGTAPAVPDEIVQAADEFARQAVSEDLRVPGVFGPEVVAPANSSRLDALAAFTGRRP